MTKLDLIFLSRFLVNILSLAVLCYGCYFRISKNAVVAGSFILFGVGVFIITFLLHDVDMSMEFAFGLFAVFTMLRYRTESISIKEMTYLFLVTAIALLTSVGQMSLIELSILNGIICLIAFLIDSSVFVKRYEVQSVCYERIENITPQNQATLISDLKQRTGLNVVAVDIEHIDFLRDVAQLKVSYLAEKQTKVA
ncbi:DUF4956 domain-containing protein [Pseudoalteromonas sp. S3776]|uniref:DUF4956 domain-containing protein n=1 Tax=Pseudoalteromonas sp. S3776 TaxID=579544 RepID=UPI001108DC70|nr:DUF4956 domain-containing protein [Pseudoalteromonas sp. S3776]TMO77182.1 DUF4956 domain-containing protein [Pseudoalteromonas sp. S3776]